jgi:spore coat protein U-like protein
MAIWQTPALRVLSIGGAALVAVAAQPVLATDTTSTLAVNATVTSNCAVSTTAVAFGNVDVTSNANVDAGGGVSVTCTNGTAWTAKASAGGGSGATITDRKMTSGANVLSYALYTDSAHTTVWGDGTTGSAITGTGTGSAQANTIYGRIPSGQTTKPVGTYADTVTVTVTY